MTDRNDMEFAYDRICAYRGEHGWSPTIRELCSMCGVKSPSTMKRWIDDMVHVGMITSNPRKPRTIVPVPREMWNAEVLRAERQQEQGRKPEAT